MANKQPKPPALPNDEIGQTIDFIIRTFSKQYRIIMNKLYGKWIGPLGCREDTVNLSDTKNYRILLKIARNLINNRCFLEEDIIKFILAQIESTDLGGETKYQYLGKYTTPLSTTKYKYFIMLGEHTSLGSELLLQFSPSSIIKKRLLSDLSYLTSKIRGFSRESYKTVYYQIFIPFLRINALADGWTSKLSEFYFACVFDKIPELLSLINTEKIKQTFLMDEPEEIFKLKKDSPYSQLSQLDRGYLVSLQPAECQINLNLIQSVFKNIEVPPVLIDRILVNPFFGREYVSE
jgi:hypothetical protein